MGWDKNLSQQLSVTTVPLQVSQIKQVLLPGCGCHKPHSSLFFNFSWSKTSFSAYIMYQPLRQAAHTCTEKHFLFLCNPEHRIITGAKGHRTREGSKRNHISQGRLMKANCTPAPPNTEDVDTFRRKRACSSHDTSPSVALPAPHLLCVHYVSSKFPCFCHTLKCMAGAKSSFF